MAEKPLLLQFDTINGLILNQKEMNPAGSLIFSYKVFLGLDYKKVDF